MNIAIVGSRHYTDYEFVKESLFDKLNYYINSNLYIQIISGGAKGVDSLAERFAKENGIDFKLFLPEWNTFGKFAGKVRNKLIVDNSDLVIAFWNGISPGTKHSLNYSVKQKKRIILIGIDGFDPNLSNCKKIYFIRS